jgi:hypothetical protein
LVKFLPLVCCLLSSVCGLPLAYLLFTILAEGFPFSPSGMVSSLDDAEGEPLSQVCTDLLFTGVSRFHYILIGECLMFQLLHD